MKKHLLTTASALTLLLATQASANESNVDQAGSNNEVTTTQTGGLAGSIDIDQTGEGSVAEVTQSELDDEDDSAAVVANIVKIDQDGIARAVVNQSANDLDSSNTATITQFSNATAIASADTPDEDAILFNVDAEIIQTGSLNSATIEQGLGGSLISNALAATEQNGLENFSDIEQTGELSDALVSQLGELNESQVTQSGLNSFADVSQIGDRNNSALVQGVDGVDNTASVLQNGDDVTSTVTQNGSGGIITSEQFGAGNSSTVFQGVDGVDNTASVLPKR